MSSAKSVLVVDDEALCRRVMLSLVSEFTTGQLHEACDGKEGLRAYRSLKPDIVFLDVDMPEMDGFEALKHIREYDADACVIIVSARATKGRVFEALKLGARHYLRKDLPRDALRPVIRQLML